MAFDADKAWVLWPSILTSRAHGHRPSGREGAGHPGALYGHIIKAVRS